METVTKDKKHSKSRKRLQRKVHETLMGSLPIGHCREISEEEEQRNKLEMSNLQLFFWKSQALTDSYPSAFELIRISPHADPADVTL